MSPQHNPQGHKYFIFEIAVSACHIEDIELEPPGSFSVPDYFQAPQDWDPIENGRLTFTTDKIRVLNISVPKLQDENAEVRLKTFFSGLLKYRSAVTCSISTLSCPTFHSTIIKKTHCSIILSPASSQIIISKARPTCGHLIPRANISYCNQTCNPQKAVLHSPRSISFARSAEPSTSHSI